MGDDFFFYCEILLSDEGGTVLTKPLLKKYLEIQNYLSKYALRIPESSRAVLIVSGKQA